MAFTFSHLQEPIKVVLLILLVYFIIWLVFVLFATIIVSILSLNLLFTYLNNGNKSRSLYLLNNSLYFLFQICLVPVYAVTAATLSILYLFIASFLNCVLLVWAILWMVYSKIIICMKPMRRKSIVFPSFDFSRGGELDDCH